MYFYKEVPYLLLHLLRCRHLHIFLQKKGKATNLLSQKL